MGWGNDDKYLYMSIVINFTNLWHVIGGVLYIVVVCHKI